MPKAPKKIKRATINLPPVPPNSPAYGGYLRNFPTTPFGFEIPSRPAGRMIVTWPEHNEQVIDRCNNPFLTLEYRITVDVDAREDGQLAVTFTWGESSVHDYLSIVFNYINPYICKDISMYYSAVDNPPRVTMSDEAAARDRYFEEEFAGVPGALEGPDMD